MEETNKQDSQTQTKEETQSQGSIPYDRFQKVIEEKKQLQSKLQEIQPMLSELDNYKQVAKEFDSFKQRVSVEKELAKFGIVDDDDIEILQHYYNKAKFDGNKKPPITDYLQHLRENPDSMPKALRAILAVEEKEKVQEKKSVWKMPKDQSFSDRSPKDISKMTKEEVEIFAKTNPQEFQQYVLSRLAKK